MPSKINRRNENGTLPKGRDAQAQNAENYRKQKHLPKTIENHSITTAGPAYK